MIEIYKSHGRYYIIVPKVAFPTFVEHYVLPCRAHLEFYGFPLAFLPMRPVFSLSNLNVPRLDFFTNRTILSSLPMSRRMALCPLRLCVTLSCLKSPPSCVALHSNLLDHETKTSKPLEIGCLSANEAFETFSRQKSLYQLERPVVGERGLGSRAVEEWQW
ncbi:hypothetical protein TNCV_1414661 [Trichonephila clavipes]|nr:hypothetical protein TNCV_1414661 [Trichonephila clavipes]